MYLFILPAFLCDLHSFPTRRSSDLGGRDMAAGLLRFLVGAIEHRRQLLGDRVVIDGDEVGHRAIPGRDREDRKSTRLNSSHLVISYAVFCLKKKKKVTAAAGLVQN